MGCACSRGASHESDIREFYKLGEVLGNGSFGQVRNAIFRADGRVYAVKIMAKNPKTAKANVDFSAMFRNEVRLLQDLSHENIIQCHELFEDEQYLYAIMDKCEGGELFTQIVKRKRFTEADASALCRQMLNALQYIHSRNIVHRDVKAENFLFAKSDLNDSRLILIDFGMSVQLTDNKSLRQLCGSPHYVAPELINRAYGMKVDMWSVGVIIFLMLYGRYPFEGRDQRTVIHQILKSDPDYNRGSNNPSPAAVAFMKKLLQKDPALRMSAEEAQKDAWLNMDINNSDFDIDGKTLRAAFRKSSMEKVEHKFGGSGELLSPKE
eukprot:GHVP01039542.1.p1 GENE.GHVP01039542.1~~GHVP01039542.1.p1  ORF type:complete len:323 (-),score=31.83 GHVP01039542.1:110-1078(-)